MNYPQQAGALVNTPKESQPVELALSRLQNAIHDLGSTEDVLAARLTSARVEEPQIPSKEVSQLQPVREATSQLEDEINRATERIGNITSHMHLVLRELRI